MLCSEKLENWRVIKSTYLMLRFLLGFLNDIQTFFPFRFVFQRLHSLTDGCKKTKTLKWQHWDITTNTPNSRTNRWNRGEFNNTERIYTWLTKIYQKTGMVLTMTRCLHWGYLHEAGQKSEHFMAHNSTSIKQENVWLSHMFNIGKLEFGE